MPYIIWYNYVLLLGGISLIKCTYLKSYDKITLVLFKHFFFFSENVYEYVYIVRRISIYSYTIINFNKILIF